MTVRCVDLRCEYAPEPIGIGTTAPRLSWRIAADGGERDVTQEAFRVNASNGWDTGWVDGPVQRIAYAGPALSSRERCEWSVRVRTGHGESDPAPEAAFEMGLLDAGEWTARMITAGAPTPVVAFASSFDLEQEVGPARLYVTAHGTVVVRINGRDASDEALQPGWTSYDRRLAVRALDVTALLRRGTNEIEAMVAPAWFSGRFGLERRPIYGTHVGLLAQLEAPGVTVGTDETWRASSTPFVLAEIYDGETFDPQRPIEPAVVRVVDGFDPATLVWPTVPPVRRTQRLRPAAVTAVDGATLCDFGQNLVGFMRVRARAAAQTQIVMRHAEVLGPDGRLFTAPLRAAKATDTFTTTSDDDTYEPAFTFHGFRYAEVSGVPADEVDVEAVVVHSDLERTGTFRCSDDLINRLHDNVVWGWRGNSVSVPTDCPQRDERLGWTGDAQVFSPTASFLYDCQTFWENWLADLAADQRDDGAVPPVVPDTGLRIGMGAAGWGDAAVVVPWTTYVAYGDDEVLRRALPSMRAWVDYVRGRLDDELRWGRDFQFGDWLDPDAPTSEPWKAKARYDLVASAYAAHAAALLVRSARILGRDDVVSSYSDHAERLRDAWWRNYAATAGDSQTGCALAIEFGLCPDPDAIGERLADLVHEAGDHLSTGFLGTPLLLPALTRTGHVDVAYRLLEQRTSPSWLYQVVAGATTIWERWDALRPDGSVAMDPLGTEAGSSMVSFNHYAYGCVADWLHRTVAGLAPDPDDPGYRHVIVEPQPGGSITAAAAELVTRYGPTSVSWRIDGGELGVDVVVPPNAHATVTLPGDQPQRVGSGAHRFTSAIRPR